MYKKFLGLSKVVRVVLLIIPFVNWVTEIIIRWDKALNTKNIVDVVMAIVFTFGGVILGFIDLIYHIFTDKLLLVD